VDFRNTVIVMTSNLGSQVIQELAGEENYDRMKSAVMGIVGGHFRPEFVNRIDDIVVFHPLGKQQLRAITEIQTHYLRDRLAARDIGMEFTTAALDKLSEAGFDPVYGARPLKRAIQTQIENPLAQEILAGHFAAGDVIVVDADGGELRFAKKAAETRQKRAAS
jgi:ATP-dependent Clp protease ATP-binding subunit ClpB